MYPSEWHTLSPSTTAASKRKRQRDASAVAEQGAASKAAAPPSAARSSPHPAPSLDMDLPQLILRNINTASRAPATPAELDLDVILSRVPYREILENLYGREDYVGVEVPIVTRVYEEAHMREPLHGERPCVAGDMCECNMISATMPFTCVEFLLPNEPPGKDPQFCVLCSRRVTQKLFYDVLLTNREVQGVIQRFGNLCNVPGEYSHECMLICPKSAPLHCMPVPIMSHQRNKYAVEIRNGVKHVKQLNVGYEDFCTPSGSTPQRD